MIIKDTKGNILSKRPDYSKGRLIQDANDSEVYIYTTYEEVPEGQGNGEQEADLVPVAD